jgi:hypothetical protein
MKRRQGPRRERTVERTVPLFLRRPSSSGRSIVFYKKGVFPAEPPKCGDSTSNTPISTTPVRAQTS